MRARRASVAGIVRTLGVVAAVAGTVALGGCSGGDDGADEATGVSDTTTTVLPKGDEATYLKAMRALDAKLVADEKTAVDSGYNLCQDRVNGMTIEAMVDDAAGLFQVDVRKAQKIVAIASTNLCK